MSKLPICYSCEKKIKGFELICSEFPNGIPKNIANQTEECNKYVAEPYNMNNDDLPIAKGR